VNLAALTSTAVGAIFALVGTVIAYLVTDHGGRKRQSLSDQRQSYLDFVQAVEAAFGALRRMCEPGRQIDNPRQIAHEAVSESHVYDKRQPLLLLNSAAINRHASDALRCLGDLRRAAGEGAKLDSSSYHRAFHPFAEARRHPRPAARLELGASETRKESVEDGQGDSVAECAVCQADPAKRSV
jgi:hypothetical protein